MSTDGSQESASLMHVTTQFEIAPEGGLEEDTNVFLDKIIYNPLIQETLFLYLDPVEFLRLARTCHLVHAIVDSFVKRTFNINRSLSRYFTDPVAFRSLQAHTGTLMSGSFALQFFDRSFYPESDLDLYVPQDFDRELMLWLLSQGYKFIPTERQSANLEEAIAQSKEPNLDDPDWNDYDAIRVARTIQAVYTFKKSISADVDDERKVQCIVANKTPMEVILSFHSTCVLNVITYKAAYSMYPRATLHERETLVCGKYPSPSRTVALEKYAARGFKVVSGTRTEEIFLQNRRSFVEGMRYMGDPACWTLALDMTGLSNLDHLDPLCDTVSATSWDLLVRYFDVQILCFLRSHNMYHVVAPSILPRMERSFFSIAENRIVNRDQFDERYIAHCIAQNPIFFEQSPRFVPKAPLQRNP